MINCVPGKPQKMSKKDQDPNQIHSDNEGIQRILSQKSQHFALGTWVVCNGVRGQITGISKDGGTELVVEWEDGSVNIIDNPRQRRSNNDTDWL